MGTLKGQTLCYMNFTSIKKYIYKETFIELEKNFMNIV